MNFNTSIFLLLSAICLFSNAENCLRGKIVNPPTRVHDTPYYFPADWDESQPAPPIDPNMDCTWSVTVPPGQYAQLEIKGAMKDTESWIQVLDAYGRIESSQLEDMVPYFFPNPKFSIYLGTEAASTFAFKITWKFLPLDSAMAKVTNQDIIVKNTSELTVATKFTATTKVSLVGIQSDLYVTDIMRAVLIFDGPTLNDPFLGNLAQVVISKDQLISSGNTLTLLNVGPTDSSIDQVVIQDHSNTMGFNVYQGLACHNQRCTSQDYRLKQDETSALISVSDIPDELIGFNLMTKGTLDVYYDIIKPENLVTTFNSTGWKQMPVTFGKSRIRQYVVHNGVQDISIDRIPK